jgi:large subunit ribosomal protein L32
MAQPKKKISRSRRGMRRSHKALKPVSTSTCEHCGAQTIPHRICSNCGTYRGREILRSKSKKET